MKKGGRKSTDWSTFTFIAKCNYSCQCLAGETQNTSKMWATLQNNIDLYDPKSFTDEVYLGCTQRASQVNNRIVMERLIFFSKLISTNLDVNLEKKNPTHTHTLELCKVTVKSVLNAVANWRTRRLSNFTKKPLAWTITKQKTRRSGNCVRIVRDLPSDCI